MSVMLRNRFGQCHVSNDSWLRIMALAEEHGGWIPAGTEPPLFNEGGELSEEAKQSWSGSYFDEQFQVVTDADALAFAEALERAKGHAPRDPLSQQMLRECINLARNGGFRIC